MLFNSYKFLIFFPIVTVLYFLLPQKYRVLTLLAASSIFYIVFIPKYIFVLLTLIVIDYGAGILITRTKSREKKRIYLIVSILSNVGMLGVFKYFNFLSVNIAALIGFLHWNYSPNLLSVVLPIGLSFHTFQSISYVVEVFKGKQKAEKNILIYALYVMFYPQLVAGPIERPQHLLPQLKKGHEFNYNSVTGGLKLMVWGFFQKLVIADRLANFVNPVYNNPQRYDGISFIVATTLFAIQIYCDFSGYVDIARGSAKVMGINLVENFNRPYFATSVREFWRRWHISLFSWFRDYLYIPLGGNRKGDLLTARNIAIVFFVTGLWHGANWTFILWGLVHGFYLIIGVFLAKLGFRLKGWLGVLPTFILICFAWIFFRANSVSDAFYISSHLFEGIENFFLNIMDKNVIYNKVLIRLPFSDFLVAIIAIGFLIIVDMKRGKFSDFDGILSKKPSWFRWGFYYAVILSILIYGVFNQTRFIYFQF